MKPQDGQTDQSSALSRRPALGLQIMLQRLFHAILKTGEKDRSGISSQRQQDGVIPPIKKMAKKPEEAIDLAAQKWDHFNQLMKANTTQLQAVAVHNERWGAIFRPSIIILSASVAVISAVVGDDQRYIATIVGGVLTALVGIEAYFQ